MSLAAPLTRHRTMSRHDTYCGIATEVNEHWAASGYSVLKTIDCQCVNGVLFIRGVVTSFFYKQMAQEAVRGVEGVDRIVNELTVLQWKQTKSNA